MVSFAELFDNSEFINVDGNTARDFLKNRVRVWVEEQIKSLEKDSEKVAKLFQAGKISYEGACNNQAGLNGQIEFCEEMLEGLK